MKWPSFQVCDGWTRDGYWLHHTVLWNGRHHNFNAFAKHTQFPLSVLDGARNKCLAVCFGRLLFHKVNFYLVRHSRTNRTIFTFSMEFLTLAFSSCSFLMWIFDRYSPCSHRIKSKKFADNELKRTFNLKECLWFCMTSLTPQGGGERPRSKNCSIRRFKSIPIWIISFFSRYF